ncbi:hypothetical protein GO308_10220 [Sphingomonas sp. SFZ2018-12]|uniref:hypothetical protein n=3 Tax=unclassified Sphingomonas TaxID=196159 RepID=UPI001F0FC53D|nr:hypothetical protein [Sphingomonas sp. SFZ2018-12]MCH4893485.1 hypothetical protein [Sphingomonas sp. SFZ2018-12]
MFNNTVITFDDIVLGSGQEARIGDGYAGFNWLQTAILSVDGTLPGYTATSGSNIAFIAEAGGTEIGGYEDAAAGSALVFTRDRPFDLISADLSAAFRSGLNIGVTAFADEAGTIPLGTVTLVVNQGATTFSFDPALFGGARRVEINANDGDSSTLDYFGIDNLTVRDTVTVITFDDIALAAGQEARIGDGYAGFNWSQTAVLSVDGSLPGYTATSGSNIAFIAEAGGTEIAGYEDAAAGSALVFSREAPFDLLSADLSAAFRNGLNISVTAFSDEAGTIPLGTVNLSVDQGAETFSFDPALLGGARRVEINANDGDGSTLDYFGIDNLTFRDAAPASGAPTNVGTRDAGRVIFASDESIAAGPELLGPGASLELAVGLSVPASTATELLGTGSL